MTIQNEAPRDNITFSYCLWVCSRTPGLVAEFDRLTGHHLSTIDRRSPMDAAIDDATGRDAAACAAFLTFVYDCVWTRGDWREI